jgi:squalene-hopene/tetraprenyl-beta-curcumene cyclase
MRSFLLLASLIMAAVTAAASGAEAGSATAPKAQYQFESITIPPARADEPKRPAVSAALAETYLRDGALAWKGSKNCISCHTTGLYLSTRPALAPYLGAPMAEMREFFVSELKEFQEMSAQAIQQRTKPAQVIYLAAGLAEWDAHLTRRLSPETGEALKLMLSLQQTNGSWAALDCWPPYESDAYHLATMAAMAVGTAPGWLAEKHSAQEAAGLARLKEYLRTTPPLHDYSRVLLLWASTRLPGLLTPAQQKDLLGMVSRRQQPDGGWSIRSFAAPEAWGGGNRAAKLRAEPDFDRPPSDGHQTGLALIVLRDAGIGVDDPRIQRGVKWLKENQRESGRWWTRSLNTDTFHFLTYSGTAFPLLALAKCGELTAAKE